MLNRAYSLVSVKDFNPVRRTFAGIATSPEPDRVGDVIEPSGVRFKNPLPLMLYHDSHKPVGEARFKRANPDGIPFEAIISTIDRPGAVQARLDEAVDSLNADPPLIRGVSIGFRPLKEPVYIKETGGFRFPEIEVLELSMVVIPAHQDATIAVVKSLDITRPAALGTNAVDVIPQLSAGASASTRVVHATTRKDQKMPIPITEQIRNFENKRETIQARMAEIMAKSAEDGVTLDDAQSEEYDTGKSDLDKINKHLTRLAELETINKAMAKPVNGDTAANGSASRTGQVITVKSVVPPGTAFTRYAMALAASRGSRLEAVEYAKRWEGSTPEVVQVLKAAVAAGTTTDSDWAAPLVVYQNLASEFIELLRPATIIGRIPGLRRVPFNVSMPTQTQGATANWVGEGKPKPVSELKFGQLTLGMSKAAGIVVLSEELVRSSNPSAEAIVRQDLIATIGQFLDRQFIDPSVAAVSGVSPASITNGITPVGSSGTNFAALQTDVAALFAAFTAANLSVSGAVWIMSETRAQALSMMLNALGQPTIPGINMTGGTMFGLPVVTSENVPLVGGSPEGGIIILVKAPEILLADDGGVTLDVSREASLQMDSAPTDPATASTVMVSLWQLNLVGLRAERFINWKRRRAEAVAFIEDANYV